MGVLCVAHFLVDFLCALLVAHIDSEQMIPLLLIYNFCAFALEMPLGLLLEGNCAPLNMGALGIVMVLGSWVLLPVPLLALTVAGVGNALFHLGGGLSVMYASDKVAPLGLFIAPGAVGIYLGAFGGSVWIVFSFLVAVGCVAFLRKQSKTETIAACNPPVRGAHLAVIALFFVVVLRGFSAGAQAFAWKESLALWVLVAVVAGKALGGYLADRFGAYGVGVGSLAVAGVCFCVPSSPVLGLLGLFAFQLTMPITLWMLAGILPKGFAFGLLTFGLFVGSLPMLLGYDVASSLPVLVLASLLLFAMGTRKGRLP